MEYDGDFLDEEYIVHISGVLPVDDYLYVGDEYCIVGGFWSKVGKAFKKSAKVFYKKVLKNKWVQRVAVLAAATTMNTFAPGSGVALIAAVAVIQQATSRNKKKSAKAVEKIRVISESAKAGDPLANDTLNALKGVREAQKEAAGEIIDESKKENP